jgi:hypothetical protein|tara:strand:- start:399 stop:623 length:225 start_codon:yes stop_codon:yes gene_type:complete
MEELEFQFFDLLQKHDLGYDRSCDHGFWMKESTKRRVIAQWLKDHPSLNWIWDAYCRRFNEGRRPLSLEELRRD